jgi:hypothetical protein
MQTSWKQTMTMDLETSVDVIQSFAQEQGITVLALVDHH